MSSKFWLIKPITHDPGSVRVSIREHNFYRATYGSKRRLFVEWIAVFPLFIVFSLFVPRGDVHAGFFSIFEKFFAGSLEEERRLDINSQNVALLQAALNSDPNPSKGGGDITIVGDSALLPDSGPLGTIADVSETSNSGQISLYVVREGDSLSQIAKMFGVSVNTIIWANDINRGDLIRHGQTLIILPVSGVQHIVAKGDTIQSIAKKYKGDAEEIMKYNGFAEGAPLSVGDTVIIPGGLGVSPIPSSAPRTPLRGLGGPEYAGYYLRPVLGAVRSQGLHGYNGIDLAAPHGREVMAAASGAVIISRDSGWNGGYGKYIVVSHSNGTQTLYAHLNGIIVHQGASVVQGQVIGYVGSTGLSSGPHLHFEVRGAKNPF